MTEEEKFYESAVTFPLEVTNLSLEEAEALLSKLLDSDPDPRYDTVQQEIRATVGRLKSHGHASDTIAKVLSKEITKLLASNPYVKPIDIPSVLTDFFLLLPVRHEQIVVFNQYKRALEKAGVDLGGLGD